MPITELMELIGFFGVLVLLATGLELLAHAQGFGPAAIVGLIAAESLGVVVGMGLFALAFNGSIQDYGERPARTLALALPLLAIGALIALVPWLLVLRRVLR